MGYTKHYRAYGRSFYSVVEHIHRQPYEKIEGTPAEWLLVPQGIIGLGSRELEDVHRSVREYYQEAAGDLDSGSAIDFVSGDDEWPDAMTVQYRTEGQQRRMRVGFNPAQQSSSEAHKVTKAILSFMPHPKVYIWAGIKNANRHAMMPSWYVVADTNALYGKLIRPVCRALLGVGDDKYDLQDMNVVQETNGHPGNYKVITDTNNKPFIRFTIDAMKNAGMDAGDFYAHNVQHDFDQPSLF